MNMPERIAQQAAENARIEATNCIEIEKVEREKQEAIERCQIKLEAEQAIIREQQTKEAAEKLQSSSKVDKQTQS